MSLSTDLSLLRRIAEGADTPADRAALADRLRAYLSAASGGASLDEVFGLATAAGKLPWWRAEALNTRDAALRALAARFYQGQPVARQAAGIRRSLSSYASSSWRFDRQAISPPPHYLGTEREMLFDALRACDAVPSASHLRRVLSGGRG